MIPLIWQMNNCSLFVFFAFLLLQYLISPSLAPASSSSSQSGPCTPVSLRQALMQLLPGLIQLALQCLHILFCQCMRVCARECVCVSVSKCFFFLQHTLAECLGVWGWASLPVSTSSFTSPPPHLLPPFTSAQFTLCSATARHVASRPVI